MAHQNNSYNNYNNNSYGNNFENNQYNTRNELYESQRKSLNELNRSEAKLEHNIKLGVTVIIMVAIIIVIALGAVIFGKSSSNEGGDNPGGGDVVTEQTIGNDTIGYVNVPNDWQQYQTINSNVFMYSDPTQTYIVALDTAQIPDKTVAEIAEQSAKNMTSDGFKEVSVNQDTLNGIDAYRIDAFSINENKWVMNWIFTGEDNLIHIVSFETPNADTEFITIPQTFRLKENTEENAK